MTSRLLAFKWMQSMILSTLPEEVSTFSLKSPEALDSLIATFGIGPMVTKPQGPDAGLDLECTRHSSP
eukprot:CAMPEP_0170592142 /NCGR_PEP_ID=MMETSP0224-20130122/12773_1 /TAXON_ID=285029 /ORGANISM="Togula jolla, Strain CCCM 725" /LENGTH=67 /DNA_ID=CAMNT_0010916041 /DNA_START=844 /DNA_END=1048 /DNA_ORIENTATION=+